MKKILFGFLLLVTVTVFGQNSKFNVVSTEKVLGKSLADNSDITGFEYAFPDRIHETFLDTTTGFLTVQLRGLSKNGKWLDNFGSIVQYDLKTKNILWNKKIAYQVNSLQQFSGTMIFTAPSKSYCLDINSGKELWEVKDDMYYVDTDYHVGLGYRFKTVGGYTNELEGIDLKTGKVIWKRELNRQYGWNSLYYTNDSTIIVVAAGLHAINLRSGKGWDYHTITGEVDYKGTVTANALGVAAGLLTGTFMMSTGHDVVRDMVSNSLIDSSFIYFASKVQLAKINKHTGDVAWRFPFSGDVAGKSTLFMHDSAIFMINKGFGFLGYRQVDFGKPFIAAFDKETGKQKFLSFVQNESDPILSFQILNDEIYLVCKNRIVKYSLKSGVRLAEKVFTKESFGQLIYVVSHQVFITADNGDFISLPKADSTKVFVYTSDKKTLVIDDQLTVTNTIKFEEISIYYLYERGYKFIAKDNKTVIVDPDGKRIAEIEATSNAFLINNTLYDPQDKRFVVIDLKNVIK